MMSASGKFIADFAVDQDAQPSKVIGKLLQHLYAEKGAAVCSMLLSQFSEYIQLMIDIIYSDNLL